MGSTDAKTRDKGDRSGTHGRATFARLRTNKNCESNPGDGRGPSETTEDLGQRGRLAPEKEIQKGGS